MTWLLLNECNFEEAKTTNLDDRTFFLEKKHTTTTREPSQRNATSAPHVIQTHLRYDLLERAITEGQPKGIVVLRNPKDVLVSQYHFYRMNKKVGPFTGTWDEFFEMFQNKELHLGFWFDHICSWWQQRNNTNFFFVKYEAMKKDPHATISKLIEFLGVSGLEDKLDELVKHIDFDSMKENKMVNRENWGLFDFKKSVFMRKGIIGDWKNYFSDDQSRFVDDLCKELAEDGLHFDFE